MQVNTLRNQTKKLWNGIRALSWAKTPTEYSDRIVTVDYSQLVAQDGQLHEQIEEAFSEKGLGVILIRGVPEFQNKRAELLPLAQRLAQLPAEALTDLERPEYLYGLGWSHGREQFKGKPDFLKVRALFLKC